MAFMLHDPLMIEECHRACACGFGALFERVAHGRHACSGLGGENVTAARDEQPVKGLDIDVAGGVRVDREDTKGVLATVEQRMSIDEPPSELATVSVPGDATDPLLLPSGEFAVMRTASPTARRPSTRRITGHLRNPLKSVRTSHTWSTGAWILTWLLIMYIGYSGGDVVGVDHDLWVDASKTV
jgi:hypothetical protein